MYLDDQLLSPTPSPNIKTQQWLESQKGFLELKIQQICTNKVGAAAQLDDRVAVGAFSSSEMLNSYTCKLHEKLVCVHGLVTIHKDHVHQVKNRMEDYAQHAEYEPLKRKKTRAPATTE